MLYNSLGGYITKTVSYQYKVGPKPIVVYVEGHGERLTPQSVSAHRKSSEALLL